ncbi:pentapeptide repeat-containing protein [Lyngbya aestuarii]|uniref:pentapeptide repeat-containing protein n=1 Tax=Lyngbya aestuarii TaxID=118322 RepID=UPI00403DE6D3
MNPPENHRIPEDKVQEVFTLAAQLYAEHDQSYSVKELMDAGTEAKIPPEFMQQALEQIQLQQNQQTAPSSQSKKSQAYLKGLAVGLPALLAVGLAGWFLAKNAATNAAIDTGLAEEVVETVEPIANSSSVSGTSLAKGNFKCAGLQLQGADLSGKNLRGADCTRADLNQAVLSDAILEGANLSHAQLRNANLNNANIRGADLAGADLAGADLSGADLQGANLSNTDLRNANLTNTNISGADLAGANLDGAIQLIK